MTTPLPALAALVVIPDSYAAVERTMDALKQQTAAGQMEIVLVVRNGAAGEIPTGDLQMFHEVRVLEMPNVLLAPALALAIRHASAPVVAMTEDHAFPAPNWAERLIAAHERSYAVVGPAMRNANPVTLVSCADFWLGYGKWAEPITSGVFDFLMEHNSSYKRALLLEYGARLQELLESETVLQYDLARRRHTFWLEATTHTAHVSFEQWGPWLACMMWHGRLFAARRAQDWTLGKRVLFALGSPLIPFIRLRRIRRDIARARYARGNRARLYCAIWVGLLADSVGQLLGYSLGSGDAPAQSVEHEFHRERKNRSLRSMPAE